MSLASKLRTIVYNIEHKGAFGSLVYHWIKYSAATFLGKVKGETNYAKWFYHLYTGRVLNLETPKRFDEKLWWLKLNNRDPFLTKCSDKNAVREYVSDCGFADILIPQIEVVKSVKDIDFKNYDCEVIIKCNHNSGGHLIYNPNEPMDKSYVKNKLRELKFILNHNAYVLSREWNYKNVPHRLVVEKVIRDQKGNLPLDYKFMCFDGEPKLLFLDLGLINDDKSYNHKYPRNIYDMEFNLLPVHESRPNADYPVDKPKNFERMIEIARKLSTPFPHCRVDLYNVDGDIYFGEITFYHGGGCNNIQPEEWDYKMGDWININNSKIVRDI